MLPSTVPRVFLLAGLVLLFLVFGTSYYLYDDVPYYPPKNPQPGSTLQYPPESEKTTSPSDEATLEGDVDEDAHEVVDVVDVVAPPTPSARPAEPYPTLVSDVVDAFTSHIPVPPPGFDTDKTDDSSDDPRPPPAPGQCIAELDFLKHSYPDLDLTDRVLYSRRCIQRVFSTTVNRDNVVNVTESLIGHQVQVDLEHCQDVRLPECVPIKLAVPEPYPKQKYSHLIFGIATDYTRLMDSVESFAHWMARTDSRLVALVTDINVRAPMEIAKLQDLFRRAGIDVSLVKPIDPRHTTSQSHFAVLTYMLNQSGPKTQWYALLDDDTFYPSLKPLSDALAKLDVKKDHYVGTLSEDFQAIRNFGFMAFGGAGAYLSATLAKKLGASASQCLEQPTEGDIILRNCVYQHSKAKLTQLPGLFQQDVKGDAAGFFESGVRALNFHHWKSWYYEPVVKMAATADYCGDCFLQRWRFGLDEVLSNGYSIAKYRDGHRHIDLSTMEGTWNKANQDFDFSIGPLRRRMTENEKKSYKLLDVNLNDNGELKQLYVWKGSGNSTAGELDEVVELVWAQ